MSCVDQSIQNVAITVKANTVMIPMDACFAPEEDLRLLDPGYCLFAVQRPLQPSARLYEPLPLLPDILPVAVVATPSALMLAER